MKSHDEMIKEWMQEFAFKKEYDSLEAEFALFDELIIARNNAGLTQAEVTERMGTKTPAIARLESGGGRNLISAWEPDFCLVLYLVLTLMVVTFTGEAIREAFDPKMYTFYSLFLISPNLKMESSCLDIQIFKGACDAGDVFVHHMGVTLRGFDVCMPHEFL
jgi:transcriptional regulator with XRE-family HTH domain